MKMVIKTNNLTKKYKDVVAVNNLNLEIYKGKLFTLLGVNGAGKTTTIKRYQHFQNQQVVMLLSMAI